MVRRFKISLMFSSDEARQETPAPGKEIFEVEVIFNGKFLAVGEGYSKKSAQIDAAYHACKSLGIIK